MTRTVRLLPIALLLLTSAVWGSVHVARAVTDTNPSCDGNVCTGTVSVGTEDVTYAYTVNHDDDSASLKVRFTGPASTTGGAETRYVVTVSEPFGTHAILKNPDPATTFPPVETVNVDNTQIERNGNDPADADFNDFTFNLGYEGFGDGTLTLDLLIAREGDQETPGPFTISFDAASPSNRDEGEDLTAIYGSDDRCHDGVDNDLDYRIDCADASCDGITIGGGSVCEPVETTCNDGEDNDGDGDVDCADPQCNGQPGNAAETKFCGAENGGASNANCADGFDNDGNGKVDCRDDDPGTGCWKTGFQDCAEAEDTPAMCSDGIDNDRDQDYTEDIDASAGTGIDCRDYDCAGIGATCPTDERLKWNGSSFEDDPSQCFNGLDDDLDGLVDCADLDCLAAFSGPQACAGNEAWLPPSPLGTGAATSTPAFYFNLCDDGVDNDGDGDIDGADTDCQDGFGLGRFGFCGPVPTTEDYTFLSCSDSIDNDLDGAVDCADSQCTAASKLGRRGCPSGACGGSTDTHETDAAVCSGSEAEPLFCGDGFDNDADGAVDCNDTDCLGKPHGYAAFGGYICSLTETGGACSDGVDNDSDGDIDCFDSECQDGISCALRPAAGWTLAPVCITVPNITAPASVVGGSVQFSHSDRIHVNGDYTLRITSPGSVTSFTATIGDAADPGKTFPFDATTCGISGPSASKMTYDTVDDDLGIITGNPGEVFLTGSLDVTLTCPNASPAVQGPDTFPLALVANRNSSVEFGETTLSVQVYESDAPTVTDLEIEGESGGTVVVPIGGSVRMQAIPSNDPSGICSCGYDIDSGSTGVTADGNCLFDTADVGLTFANDFTGLSVDVSAVDGADNESATSSHTVDVNVIPSVQTNLTLGGPLVHSYRSGDLINLSTTFVTDTASDFDAATCGLYLFDETNSPSLQVSPNLVATSLGTTLTCAGTFEVPAGLSAGRWHLSIQAFDSSGDAVRSNAQAFLKCDLGDVGTGACADADFDYDGVPEGRYTPDTFPSPPTPTYDGSPPVSCDNCINFYNPSQTDRDANGVGDACEAGSAGRCKYVQCSGGDNPGDPCTSDDDCTGGGECKDVAQDMCTINCTVDADCQSPNTVVDGICSSNWGVCEDNEFESAPDVGFCCFNDRDCSSGSCAALVDPFIETEFGQIYSGGSISAAEEPPIDNATYCIQANGDITNFTSAFGCELPRQQGYELPKASKSYRGSFGILDVIGITSGKYGTVTDVTTVPANLGGGIYRLSPGNVTGPVTFQNGSGTRGNGLIVVIGDLHLDANTAYTTQNVVDLSTLASVGWIVLDDGSGTTGNVYIDGAVDTVVGAIFAEGIISTGSSDKPLKIDGMMVAKGFAFERTYASQIEGSEQVEFDARVILNPPPGMTDITRSLPGFRSVSGQ